MYTVEFEPDASIITTIDEKDMYFDVEMILADEGSVLLQQFPDDGDDPQHIFMSFQQFLDLAYSLKSPEGAYYLAAPNK